MTDYIIPRDAIWPLFRNPRYARAFELQQLKLAEVDAAVSTTLPATQALKEATYVTLSANAELPNERVLQFGGGIGYVLTDTTVTIALSNGAVKAEGGFDVRLIASGETRVSVPMTGTLATRENAETLSSKTLAAPKLSGLVNAVDDTAAASGGVPVGGVYHNSGALRVRLV